MLIVMDKAATEAQINDVAAFIRSLGMRAKLLPGSIRTTVGVMGNAGYVDADRVGVMPGVLEITTSLTGGFCSTLWPQAVKDISSKTPKKFDLIII